MAGNEGFAPAEGVGKFRSKVIFSKRWERYDNVHLKDKTKDVRVEAYAFGNAVRIVEININGDVIYVEKIFSLAELQNMFAKVKTFRQFKRALANLIAGE